MAKCARVFYQGHKLMGDLSTGDLSSFLEIVCFDKEFDSDVYFFFIFIRVTRKKFFLVLARK